MLPLSADQWLAPLCAPSAAPSPPLRTLLRFPFCRRGVAFSVSSVPRVSRILSLCALHHFSRLVMHPSVGIDRPTDRFCVGDIGEKGTLQLLDVWTKVREWQRGTVCTQRRATERADGCRVCTLSRTDVSGCQILTGAALLTCARGL